MYAFGTGFCRTYRSGASKFNTLAASTNDWWRSDNWKRVTSLSWTVRYDWAIEKKNTKKISCWEIIEVLLTLDKVPTLEIQEAYAVCLHLLVDITIFKWKVST